MNYRDLLKYANTGIASEDMTYYDRMFCEASKERMKHNARRDAAVYSNDAGKGSGGAETAHGSGSTV